jgi:RNA polymerase sigma-B factor
MRVKANPTEMLWGYYKSRVKSKPSPHARNQIAVSCHNLVRGIAHRAARQCAEPYADLEQIGMIGLLRAIDRFDPTKGVSFSSFAVPYIRGEILHFLRDHATVVKIPRRWNEFHAQANKIERHWVVAKGRPPTETELAKEMGTRVTKLRLVREAIANRKSASFETEFDGIDSPAACSTLLEPVAPGLEAAWNALKESYSQLNERDRQLIESVYLRRVSRKLIAQQVPDFKATMRSVLNRLG